MTSVKVPFPLLRHMVLWNPYGCRPSIPPRGSKSYGPAAYCITYKIEIAIMVVVDECEAGNVGVRCILALIPAASVTSLNVPFFSLCSSSTRPLRPTARSVAPSLS